MLYQDCLTLFDGFRAGSGQIDSLLFILFEYVEDVFIVRYEAVVESAFLDQCAYLL